MLRDPFSSGSPPNDVPEESCLQQLGEQGVLLRYGTQLPGTGVLERLRVELELISHTGFTKHFLLMRSIVDYARRSGITVGLGREWQPSSLVAYVLGITDVDPLRYGLIFEMWLNPERVTAPDITVDIAYNHCDELIECVLANHGQYVVPVEMDEHTDTTESDAQHDDLWKRGYLAFDLHRKKNLAVNATVLNVIRETKRVEMSLIHLPLDDDDTYRLLSRGQVLGIFEVDSAEAADTCRRLKPTRIQDIFALVAFTTWELDDYLNLYVVRKHGTASVTYDHPLLESILQETHGIMQYREQYVQAVESLAGYSRGKADLLRRANLRNGPPFMEIHRPTFVEGCARKNNIPAKTANQLFDMLNTITRGGFSKSHAVSSGLLAYQTAYLKAHYPAEFYSALIEHHRDDSEFLPRIQKEMTLCGLN